MGTHINHFYPAGGSAMIGHPREVLAGTSGIASAGRRFPLVGHLPALAKDPLGFISSASRRGDMVRIWLGPQETVLVCDPELTRQMLLDDATFDKGGAMFENARRTVGNGLTVCPHGQHRRERRLCQPSFQPPRLADYAHTFSAVVEKEVGTWQDGQVIEVTERMMALTSRVIIETMFSDTLSPEQVRRATADVRIFMDGTLRTALTPPFLAAMPFVGTRHFDQAAERMRATLVKAVTHRREFPGEYSDLLSVLCNASDPNSPADQRVLSEAELADQVINFFVAGTETTALTLAWSLYLLDRHPQWDTGVHGEAVRTLNGHSATYECLPLLETTGRVLTETLRLFPPAWLITRKMTQDSSLGRVRLPAGTMLAYSPYVINRLPSAYTDPDRFDPDRWVNTTVGRNAFIPFGAGPRKCIGDRFAMAEATIILATIASRWRLSSIDKKAVKPFAAATLRPRGLRMRAVAR
ncbi:cytochrome P450 [Streptomyces sp. IBSNAI002]|uniref:cytochrome P450 n=1 Tax=Streptomyces sp. IBSNAI002 TaxID=3457500 RepID=UPI003FD24E30